MKINGMFSESSATKQRIRYPCMFTIACILMDKCIKNACSHMRWLRICNNIILQAVYAALLLENMIWLYDRKDVSKNKYIKDHLYICQQKWSKQTQALHKCWIIRVGESTLADCLQESGWKIFLRREYGSTYFLT